MSGKRCRARRSNYRRRKQKSSRSTQGDLQCSDGCISRLLQEGRFSQCLSPATHSFLATILKRLTAYILELAAEEARRNRRKYITPQHVDMAVYKNHPLGCFLRNVTSSQAKNP